MSTPDSSPSTGSTGTQKHVEPFPLDSSADVGRANYARVNFDQHISGILMEHAQQRAPHGSSDRSYRNHLLGIASEVAVATWRDGRINTKIYPDYEGDDGVDVVAPSRWGSDIDTFQVKGTRNITTPEQSVSQSELESADYFVLCASNSPETFVEIVGYVPRPVLRHVGVDYLHSEYLLSPEYLFPVKPQHYGPNDVRDAMYE